MIRRISANKSEFQPVEFKSGLNVILAERAPDATDQDTRNARGKTSIIQIINYCLGSNLPKEFRPLKEADWSFTLDFDVFGEVVRATRSVNRPTKLTVEAPGLAGMVIDSYRREDGQVSIDDWKRVLGIGFFSVDTQADPAGSALSVRTLLSYMIRLDVPKEPTKFMSQQPAISSRTSVAFLLDLDWKMITDLEEIKKEQESFKALADAQEASLVPGLELDEGEIQMQRLIAERELAEAERNAESFSVLDDPEGTVSESNRVAEELTMLKDEQLRETRLLQLYEKTLSQPSEEKEGRAVGEVYRELGLIFSPETLRRFEEVEEFHRSVIENRRRFLNEEVSRLSKSIRRREPLIRDLNARRQDLARRLQSGGGVDDLVILRSNIAEISSRLESLRTALDLIRQVQGAKDSLDVRRATIVKDARERLSVDREFADRFISRFSEILAVLYDKSASLMIKVDDQGYSFVTQVVGSSSTGVNKMKLFAFDLALLELVPNGRHPEFLIHDSVVFDGVDDRQVGTAIRMAYESLLSSNRQYIITMNSNDVPDSIASEQWFRESVRREILDTEFGGALGLVF